MEPHNSSLHSVRKSPLKTMMKKPIAPLPPTRPKVYKVDPMNFRDLVQKLTGAGAANDQCRLQQPHQRLKNVAPPPINVSSGRSFCDGDGDGDAESDHAPLQLLPFPALYKELMSEMSDQKSYKLSDCAMASNSLGLSLSPSSYNWCSYPLLSPGSLSQLGV